MQISFVLLSTRLSSSAKSGKSRFPAEAGKFSPGAQRFRNGIQLLIGGKHADNRIARLYQGVDDKVVRANGPV